MIRGYLEAVSSTEARGWAFDTKDPTARPEVCVYDGTELLGRVRANLYRHDLRRPELGNGEHAFVLRFDKPLETARADLVFAQVEQGSTAAVKLERFRAEPAPASALDRGSHSIQVEWTGQSVDTEARPLFILGAARSGTSAVAHALLESTNFIGNQEGHVWDVLAPFSVQLGTFYAIKADERDGGRNTTIRRVPRSYFDGGLNSILITLARSLFGVGPWLDKTPNSNMVHLAPRFLQIWPNAKFIFMRRRPIDNILSRQRKFDYDFGRNCREWADSMQAWSVVRSRLSASSIELDQAQMAKDPFTAASSIARLLGLSDIDEKRIATRLLVDHPQRTAAMTETPTPIDATGWTTEQREIYFRICGDLALEYGYIE